MAPVGKTFDPETVTDKQLVQYEQAIDRGLTEADAMRLAEHEYNGFQANAIIAAALNPAVGEDVLDALATPKYTAAQMTAIAKIAIRGGDFTRFLDPQMDARRMEAAYLVVAHGGSDLPVERLSRSQLLTINNLLLQGHIPYETVRAIAKPAFSPESMEVIAAAMENARHDPYTGEHSLTEDALGTPEEQGIRAMLIATGEPPREVTLLPDKNGSTLKSLQALVGGNIETFDIAFGEEVSLYVNEEGLFTCPPNFSIEQVKRFPELLASPVVLANSPTRDDVLLAILLATDAYDTPLIAGIKPDGTGNYGEREVETNMVLSVYSRQNFIRYFALLRDMDAFVFVSGKKIEALEDLSGLPLAGNCSGLDIDRILQRPKCLG